MQHLLTHDATGEGLNCSLCWEEFNINTTFKGAPELETHMRRHFTDLVSLAQLKTEQHYNPYIMQRIAEARQGDGWFKKFKDNLLKMMTLQKYGFHIDYPYKCADCPDEIKGYFRTRDELLCHKWLEHDTGPNMPPGYIGPEPSPSVPVLPPGSYELAMPVLIDQELYTGLHVLPQRNP